MLSAYGEILSRQGLGKELYELCIKLLGRYGVCVLYEFALIIVYLDGEDFEALDSQIHGLYHHVIAFDVFVNARIVYAPLLGIYDRHYIVGVDDVVDILIIRVGAAGAESLEGVVIQIVGGDAEFIGVLVYIFPDQIGDYASAAVACYPDLCAFLTELLLVSLDPVNDLGGGFGYALDVALGAAVEIVLPLVKITVSSYGDCYDLSLAVVQESDVLMGYGCADGVLRGHVCFLEFKVIDRKACVPEKLGGVFGIGAVKRKRKCQGHSPQMLV